jgi:hypothetical protein
MIANVTVPRTVGRNVDTLFDHFAADIVPIKLRDSGFQADADYLNLLTLPCDPERTLKAVSIEVVVPDIQFGLIGLIGIRVPLAALPVRG